LATLRRADYAAFNTFKKKESPPRECFEGTRVDILNQIQNWSEGHDNKCIFWLNGMAGTGKSTIARSVARRFYERGRLGASFFFSKGNEDLGDATIFLTTLAVQPTEVLPDLKSYVCNAIAKHGDIGQQPMVTQWKHLILEPLVTLGNGLLLPFVLILVIDALDECEGDEALSMILQLLPEVKDLENIRLRIFITSRPETSICLGFRKIPEIAHHDLMLHSIPQEVIEHDISLYLRHELFKIGRKHLLEEDWPGEDDIQKLVQKAGQLFIYAATACRFLSKSTFPKKQLSEMLQVNSSTNSSTKELDEMYMLVLKHLINEGNDEDNGDITTLFKRVVGSITVLFNTLSATALTGLLAVSVDEMNGTLDPLQSVLSIPEDKISPLQLFHLSFRDFLLDQKRCSDLQFWIHEKKAHRDVFLSCLKAMSNHLTRDMCHLGQPGVLATEVEKSTVERNLSPDVQYACQFWVDHFQWSEIEPCNYDQIHQFLEEHFLHWLESLSLIRKVSEGVLMMTTLLSILSVSGFVPYKMIPETDLAGIKPDKQNELYAMVYDARRFMLHHKTVIEVAPLQVYDSALIFSPATSVVRNLFSDQLPTWIKCLPMVENCWSHSLQSLEGHSDAVLAVAFSPNGELASASRYQTLRLWNSATGAMTQILTGHLEEVCAVAFSPDGRLLASGSRDNTIRLWDPATQAIKQIEGFTTQPPKARPKRLLATTTLQFSKNNIIIRLFRVFFRTYKVFKIF
jgi:hypothetical protein